MKTVMIAGLVLGLGLGIASAVFRIQYLAPWYNRPPAQSKTGIQAPKRVEPAVPAPAAVVVGGQDYDFGVMEADAVGSHVFVLRNEGNAPLQVRQGEATCKCTVGLIGTKKDKEKGEEYVDIPPGESTQVTLEWKTKGFKGDFQQTATFKTNDLKHIDLGLTVKGRVLEPYIATPPEVLFTNVPAGEGAKTDVSILGYRKVPFDILGVEFTEAQTAKFFDVTHEPLPAEEVAKDKQAHNGQLVHIALKPGLPSGRFLQKILLSTSTDKEAAKVEIPIQGIISSELSVIGSGWSESAQMVSLGHVPRGTGTERTLRVLARGPNRKDVKLKIKKVVPDLLHVTIGEASDWEQVTQTPLTVSIPKGSRLARFLGPEESDLGQITLETNCSSAPELRILVRFAVVD